MMYRFLPFLMVAIGATEPCESAQVQVIESDLPQLFGGGHFGLSLALDGETLAIGSQEGTSTTQIRGRVAIYSLEGTSGTWQHVQDLTAGSPFPPPYGGAEFGGGVAIVGESMIVSGRQCWEFERVAGIWQPREHIRTPPVPGWIGLGWMNHVSFDGQTLLTGFNQAQVAAGQLDPAAMFWERHGTWTPVQTFRGSSLGLPVDNTGFGSVTALHGDVAAVSAIRAASNGIPDVGRVLTFRRIQGVWQHERTLLRPGIATHDHGFGMSLAMDENWLFVHCSRDVGDVPGIYVYRADPSQGWVLDSKIHPTVDNTAGLPALGLGAAMEWSPPFLAVTAGSHTVPPAGAHGVGAVFVFERCGDIWNQRIGLAPPASFNDSGIGTRRDGLAFDGTHIAVGGPDWFGGNPPLNDRGIAAVAPFQAPPPGPCLEVGRIACDPSTAETTDCPCGAPMTPGRGCPNTVGSGGRLFVHGGFNEAEVRRVLVEGLPPDSTVLLAVGHALPGALPAGVISGEGVWCIDPTLANLRRVGRSDAAGVAVFDHVLIQPPFIAGNVTWQLPLQALYRSPAPGLCGRTWNATQAVQFTLSGFGFHIP